MFVCKGTQLLLMKNTVGIVKFDWLETCFKKKHDPIAYHE